MFHWQELWNSTWNGLSERIAEQKSVHLCVEHLSTTNPVFSGQVVGRTQHAPGRDGTFGSHDVASWQLAPVGHGGMSTPHPIGSVVMDLQSWLAEAPACCRTQLFQYVMPLHPQTRFRASSVQGAWHVPAPASHVTFSQYSPGEQSLAAIHGFVPLSGGPASPVSVVTVATEMLSVPHPTVAGQPRTNRA